MEWNDWTENRICLPERLRLVALDKQEKRIGLIQRLINWWRK